MLTIREIKPSDLETSVEVDPYVPIVVRTFATPFGAVFYRVGNFETSLVEVPIDPSSGTVRGIKLISLDRIGIAVDESKLPQILGLPITVRESIPDRRREDHREIKVALLEDRLVVEWTSGEQVDTKSVHGRLAFLMGGGTLLGAVIDSITPEERQLLVPHLLLAGGSRIN